MIQGLTSFRQKIVDTVIKAGEHGITTNKLVNIMYADDINGGPDTAVKSIHTTVCKINKILKQHDFQIKSERGRNNYGYKIMKTLEGKVKEDVKKYLTAIGAYYFMPVQMGYGQSTLDFLVCWKGRFIGIECKRPGLMEPTARQSLIMAQITRADGHAFVVDSVEMLRNYITDVA